MHIFTPRPVGGFRLLAEYTEELAFCHEMCIETPTCVAVGTKETVNTCLVLVEAYQCQADYVWMEKPYQVVVP